MSIVKLAGYFSEETHKGHAPLGAAGGAVGAAIGGGHQLHKYRHFFNSTSPKGKFKMAATLLGAIGVGAGAGAGIGSLVRRKMENS
jgi:hypothetical protein